MLLPDSYRCYAELEQSEKEGDDYRIRLRRGRSGILVMAPHGGNIEPGTSEIADAVASGQHAFYSFDGLKPAGNWSLHIASTNFDEPCATFTASRSETILAIHGCRDEEHMVYVGGLDRRLRSTVETALAIAGFASGERNGLQGESPQNICNQSANAMGVQVEISARLRSLMFEDLRGNGRKNPTPIFENFTAALREALACTRLGFIA